MKRSSKIDLDGVIDLWSGSLTIYLSGDLRLAFRSVVWLIQGASVASLIQLSFTQNENQEENKTKTKRTLKKREEKKMNTVMWLFIARLRNVSVVYFFRNDILSLLLLLLRHPPLPFPMKPDWVGRDDMDVIRRVSTLWSARFAAGQIQYLQCRSTGLSNLHFGLSTSGLLFI